MKKYICSVCGYVYDEAAGIPDDGIAAGTKFEDLPEDWACPLCGAGKDEFETEQQEAPAAAAAKTPAGESGEGLSYGAVSVLFSNLAKGFEKQMKSEQMQLAEELSDYFKSRAGTAAGTFDDISELIGNDINAFAAASEAAKSDGDRGALRALVWADKVAKIQSSVLKRYKKDGNKILEDKNIYVCDICGFVYIGDKAPDLCPVCKVPKLKISQVGR